MENPMGFGKDGKGVIIRESRNQLLSTLDNQAGIIVDTKLATLERYRMIKVELHATVVSLTSGEGTGLIIGIADGDLTLAEIEASIEAQLPLGPNDTVGAAIAERFVMFLGALDRETGTVGMFENEQGGHMMSKTIRWTFARTKSWNYFVYNLGDQLTTGSNLFLRAKSFGVWVT